MSGSPRERHDLMALAKNPTPGTKIYRGYRNGEGPESGSVGIHWSTNRDVAAGIGTNIHEATIDDPHAQVIPHGALSRRQFNTETGEVRRPSDANMMGFDWEAEVRLRPGAKLRMASGETHTVEHQSDMDYGPWHSIYKHLGDQSAPGSAEQTRHWGREQTHLGMLQPALFDELTNRHTGEVLGYASSMSAAPSIDAWSDEYSEAHTRLAAKYGLDEYEDIASNEMTVKSLPHAGR